MDVGMADLNGIEATRQIRDFAPDTRVIALSMHADKRFVGRMLQAGASGYLLKDCAFEELIDAIRNVQTGKVHLSQGVTGVVVEAYLSQLSTGETLRRARCSPRPRAGDPATPATEGRSTQGDRRLAAREHQDD